MQLATADRLATHFLRLLLAVTVVLLADATAVHVVNGCFAAAGFVGAYLVWMLSEARITTGAPRQSAAENRTLVCYAGARVTTALTAAYADSAAPAGVAIVLAGVFGAGVALRAWAIRVLGARYSHRVLAISGSDVICSGPYRVLRHPAYAGMLLANAGFVGYFASPASLAGLAVLAAAILWRIKVEEDVLFGSSAYREFACSRRRLVPGVW